MLDDGDAVDIIYCDFMRAFDKVLHRWMLVISSYKIGETCLKWTEAFLNNRRQWSYVGMEKSEKWSSTGISIGTTTVCPVYKLFVRGPK